MFVLPLKPRKTPFNYGSLTDHDRCLLIDRLQAVSQMPEIRRGSDKLGWQQKQNAHSSAPHLALLTSREVETTFINVGAHRT